MESQRYLSKGLLHCLMFVTSLIANNSKESNIIIIILHRPLPQNSPSFSEDDSLFEEEEEDAKIPLLKVSCFLRLKYMHNQMLLVFSVYVAKKYWSFIVCLFLQSPHSIAPASIAPPVCTQYPADWSLKTRLLFTSPMSLSWAEQPKAQEEALGIIQHCRAQFSSLPHSLQVGFFFFFAEHQSFPRFPEDLYFQS